MRIEPAPEWMVNATRVGMDILRKNPDLCGTAWMYDTVEERFWLLYVYVDRQTPRFSLHPDEDNP